MDDRNMVKMLVMGNPGGKRRQQGRAKKRWLDDVENGFRYSRWESERCRLKSSVRDFQRREGPALTVMPLSD